MPFFTDMQRHQIQQEWEKTRQPELQQELGLVLLNSFLVAWQAHFDVFVDVIVPVLTVRELNEPNVMLALHFSPANHALSHTHAIINQVHEEWKRRMHRYVQFGAPLDLNAFHFSLTHEATGKLDFKYSADLLLLLQGRHPYRFMVGVAPSLQAEQANLRIRHH